VFGLVHGLFAGIALVNVLLPVIHPGMAHIIERRRCSTTARTTRIHDAQLWAPHAAGDDHRPCCLGTIVGGLTALAA
jgi:hypothetical protein